MKTALLPLVALFLVPACGAGEPVDAGVVEPSFDGKSDAFSGVVDGGTLAFGDEVTGTFDEDFQFFEYSFRAREDAELDIEITHLGSSQGLDTTLFLYRNEPGEAPSRIAFDDDDGWGALSQIEDFRLFSEGDYTIVVGTKGARGRGNFRLTLGCLSGECGPVQEPAVCHPHLEEALQECLAEYGTETDYEVAGFELVGECEGWVDDSTEALCPDEDEPLCFDSTDQVAACLDHARAQYARPTTALTEDNDGGVDALAESVWNSDNCSVGEDAGCWFDATLYAYEGDAPSAAQLLAFAREASEIGPGAYLRQTLEAERTALTGVASHYGVTDAFEAMLQDAGLDLDEAEVSVTETFGEIQWNHGDCEGGSIVAVFPSRQAVLILEDLFCYG